MAEQVNQTADAKRPPMAMGERGFQFDFENMQRFAQALIEGGMVPKSVKSPGAVIGLIEAGKNLGLPPMVALSNLTFTNGRIGIMGDAAKALIRRAGALEPGTDFEEEYSGREYSEEWTCTVSAQRIGQPNRTARSFSLGEAVRAGLAKIVDGKVLARAYDGFDTRGPWANYTARMLMYRALGFLARDEFSDVLFAFPIAEELRDLPPVPRERNAPPPGRDPLLASVQADEAEVIEESADSGASSEAEKEEEAEPQEGALHAELRRRAAEFIDLINGSNTIVGEAKVWNRTESLRVELAAILPEVERAIVAAHAARRKELGAKD